MKAKGSETSNYQSSRQNRQTDRQTDRQMKYRDKKLWKYWKRVKRNKRRKLKTPTGSFLLKTDFTVAKFTLKYYILKMQYYLAHWYELSELYLTM